MDDPEHVELLSSIQHQLEIEGNHFTLEEINDAIQSLDSLSEDLIVTNLPDCVYKIGACKNEFEALFQTYDSGCRFAYLPSFSRAKVMMNSMEAALTARFHLDKTSMKSHIVPQSQNDTGNEMSPGTVSTSPEAEANQQVSDYSTTTSSATAGSVASCTEEGMVQIGCYFSQKSDHVLNSLGLKSTSNNTFLEPPLPEKQFLISPPASPPVGWEPKGESEPVINYDLLAALSKLAPGEEHELQPSVGNKPSIVLTPCPEEDEQDWRPRMKIVQTKCPERRL